MNQRNLKVLFIGGTGVISSASSRLALEKGIDLYLLNRNKSSELRPVNGAKVLQADIRDANAVKEVTKDHRFDVIVDFMVFHPDHIKQDIELFSDKTGQYIFISTASAYQTPPRSLPVTEDTPLDNPYWQYSRDKTECENILMKAYRKDGFPATIVRPSHTYDKTLPPLEGGYTVLDRMKKGKEVVIHGDGSSIWTVTHHKDFAKGLVGLLGNDDAIGEDFHITSDHWISWLEIFRTFAEALGVELKPVFVPSDKIAEYNKKIGASLLGDKTHSMIFDNSKIKSYVKDFKAETPLKQGAEEIVKWYEENPQYCNVDQSLNKTFDEMIKDQKK